MKGKNAFVRDYRRLTSFSWKNVIAEGKFKRESLFSTKIDRRIEWPMHWMKMSGFDSLETLNPASIRPLLLRYPYRIPTMRI
jgi:hypothetical protein